MRCNCVELKIVDRIPFFFSLETFFLVSLLLSILDTWMECMCGMPKWKILYLCTFQLERFMKKKKLIIIDVSCICFRFSCLIVRFLEFFFSIIRTFRQYQLTYMCGVTQCLFLHNRFFFFGVSSFEFIQLTYFRFT